MSGPEIDSIIRAADAHLEDCLDLSFGADAIETAQLQALRSIACSLIAIAHCARLAIADRNEPATKAP